MLRRATRLSTASTAARRNWTSMRSVKWTQEWWDVYSLIDRDLQTISWLVSSTCNLFAVYSWPIFNNYRKLLFLLANLIILRTPLCFFNTNRSLIPCQWHASISTRPPWFLRYSDWVISHAWLMDQHSFLDQLCICKHHFINLSWIILHNESWAFKITSFHLWSCWLLEDWLEGTIGPYNFIIDLIYFKLFVTRYLGAGDVPLPVELAPHLISSLSWFISPS